MTRKAILLSRAILDTSYKWQAGGNAAKMPTIQCVIERTEFRNPVSDVFALSEVRLRPIAQAGWLLGQRLAAHTYPWQISVRFASQPAPARAQAHQQRVVTRRLQHVLPTAASCLKFASAR
jgi:hypothetical protein